MAAHIACLDSISEIDAAAWNRLTGTGLPFLRHEFLTALEQHGCVGPGTGWRPRPLALFDDNGELLGAIPLYEKHHSWGEFVFDWAWADAYERNGLDYYPKLIVAAPFTPATGPRCLTSPDCDRNETTQALVTATLDLAETLNVSSLHWLFTQTRLTEQLRARGLLIRTGCQFHWHNQGYRDFADFLATLRANRRKKIRRERRRVEESNIRIDVLHGDDISAPMWQTFYEFYCSTYGKRGHQAPLTLEFFRALGRNLPEQVVLFVARADGRDVAHALCLRDQNTLYGRHWGCIEEFDSLHFELCYYTGIDYCITHDLKHFEPGAQGEHKIWRGFLPTATWSAHWITDPRFRKAIGQHLVYETEGMTEYISELKDHSPYRQESG